MQGTTLLLTSHHSSSSPLLDSPLHSLTSAACEGRAGAARIHDKGAPERCVRRGFGGAGCSGAGSSEGGGEGGGGGGVADRVAEVAAVQREGVHGVRWRGQPRVPRRDLRRGLAPGGRPHGRRRPRPPHHPPQEAELGGRVARLRRRRGVAVAVRAGTEEVHGAASREPAPDQVSRSPVAGAGVRRRGRGAQLPLRRGGLLRRALPRRVRLPLRHLRRGAAAARGGNLPEGGRRRPGRVSAGGGARLRAGARHGCRHPPRPDARTVKTSPCRRKNLTATSLRHCHKEEKTPCLLS